jgi:hypothetical protein
LRARRVVAPDGGTWVIRRHWIARPPSLRRLLRPTNLRDWKVPKWMEASADLLDEGFLVVLAVVGILALLVFFLIPALIFVVELVLFVALASLVLFVNSLFRRPWIVEAVQEQPVRRVMRWRVVGFLSSRRAIAEIAQALSQGQRHIEIQDGELVNSEA